MPVQDLGIIQLRNFRWTGQTMKFQVPKPTTPWSCSIWEGKVSVAFGYAEWGWISLAVMTTPFCQSTIIDCSEVFDPFPDMEKWLRKIRLRKLPAEWHIDIEGSLMVLRALPEKGDRIDFQVWTVPYEENSQYPPKMLLRSRLVRVQLLQEFYRRFTRYVKEDYNPRQWISGFDQATKEERKITDLRSINLSFIKSKFPKSDKILNAFES
jgi:hypothetical protein